jgi:hypothetical protein
MRLSTLAVLICFIALTACSAGVEETIPTATTTAKGPPAKTPLLPTSTPTRPRPTPTTPPQVTVDRSEPLIVFNRSGGFAGVDEAWRIYADGRIIDHLGREMQVSPAAVDQLWRDIRDSGFFTFADTYLPKDPCCDRFTYVITVRDGDSEHTVTTMDQTPNAPSELFDIIQGITVLVNLGR